MQQSSFHYIDMMFWIIFNIRIFISFPLFSYAHPANIWEATDFLIFLKNSQKVLFLRICTVYVGYCQGTERFKCWNEPGGSYIFEGGSHTYFVLALLARDQTRGLKSPPIPRVRRLWIW